MQFGTITLMDDQVDALKRMRDGCVLQGGVGSGKTYTSLAYFLEHHSHKDLLVITTAKVRDDGAWMRAAGSMHLTMDRVTVDSWNNIDRYRHIEPDQFFIILDEQRLVGTGAWTTTFWKMARNNPWILLSATPGDTWSDYAPVFIANGFYDNITQFRREHAIYSRFTKFPKIERYFNEGTLLRHRNRVLVKMVDNRHTTRHLKIVDVPYDEPQFDKVWKMRWNIFEDKPLKDAGELFRVARKLVGSDQRRVEAVRQLANEHKKIIVFYNFDYELQLLREMCEEWKNETENGTPASLTRTPTDHGLRGVSSKLSSPESCARNAGDRSKSAGAYTPIVEGTGTHSGATSTTSPTTSSTQTRLAGSSSRPSPKDAQKNSGTNSLLREMCEEWKTQAESGRTFSQPNHTLPSSGNPGSVGNAERPSGTAGERVRACTEWNGHFHQDIPDTDEWIYLVQYSAGAEGWNCISTNTVVFYSLTYSYKQFEQAQGRIDRRNTPFHDLYYYVLMSKAKSCLAVWRALQRKKSFNTRGFSVERTPKAA